MSKKKTKKKSKSRKTKMKNKKGMQVIIKNKVETPAEPKKTNGIWSFLRKLASAFLP